MIIYTHNDCLKKFNVNTHPERKERLESILSSIKSSNLKVEFKEAPLADLEAVSLVHPKQHIEQIFSNIPKEGIVGVEKEPYADTMLCPDSKIKNHILKKSVFAVSKSGTISLEICQAKIPSVILYKMGLINFFIIKMLVKTKFANIINIAAKKEIIPELLESNCNPKKLFEVVSN